MGKKVKNASQRYKQGSFKLPSPREIEDSKTPAGAWTAAQLAEWGVSWPPRHGWRVELERRWRMQNTGPETVIRPATNEDFEGKTISRIEFEAVNLWRLWFTDGTSFAIDADSRNGFAHMEIREDGTAIVRPSNGEANGNHNQDSQGNRG